MALTIEQQTKGRKKFLASHPDVQKNVDEVSEAMANALGVSVEALREETISQGLATAAGVAGVDSFEFLLMFAADSEEEFNSLLEERNNALMKAIGV